MPINQEHDIPEGSRSLGNGYYMLGNGKLACPSDGHQMGISGVAHVVLMALESFGTQEEFNRAQRDWHENMGRIREQESKRASERRRAREDAIRAREAQEKTPPVPGLVATFQHSYSGILGARNHL